MTSRDQTGLLDKLRGYKNKLAEKGATPQEAKEGLERILPCEIGSENYKKFNLYIKRIKKGYVAIVKYTLYESLVEESIASSKVYTPGTGAAPPIDRAFYGSD